MTKTTKWCVTFKMTGKVYVNASDGDEALDKFAEMSEADLLDSVSDVDWTDCEDTGEGEDCDDRGDWE